MPRLYHETQFLLIEEDNFMSLRARNNHGVYFRPHFCGTFQQQTNGMSHEFITNVLLICYNISSFVSFDIVKLIIPTNNPCVTRRSHGSNFENP
jgi:hypothetical protein